MGNIIDILRHGTTSGTAVSEADGRITFNYAQAGPNIQLHWNTAQATLLPNEAVTVFGDLKITSTSAGQTVHHIRRRLIFYPK